MSKAAATVRFINGPTILLRSGCYFDYEEPASSAFTIDDIAHGLSMTCRFGGHCRDFYSVAEHSVHVSRFVPTADAYGALMHDAAEAFVGDIPKPLKVLLPDFRAIEKRIETAIFERFSVPNPLPASVKEMDVVMLATEQRHLMRNRDDWDYTRGRTPLEIEIPCLSPKRAKRLFLDRFAEVTAA